MPDELLDAIDASEPTEVPPAFRGEKEIHHGRDPRERLWSLIDFLQSELEGRAHRGDKLTPSNIAGFKVVGELLLGIEGLQSKRGNQDDSESLARMISRGFERVEARRRVASALTKGDGEASTPSDGIDGDSDGKDTD